MTSLLAIVVVRAATLPSGGAEAVAEAGGRVLLVGEGAGDAAAGLAGVATEVRVWDTEGFAPGAWAEQLAPLVASETLLVLPASPDGRDLAPRLAAVLERPLYAGAMEMAEHSVTTIAQGGRVLAEHPLTGPAVVTLQPGVRSVVPSGADAPVPESVEPTTMPAAAVDATVDELVGPDVSTMDLSEAPRILGGGAGLDSSARFVQLGDVAAALDASMGATRVITDRGWIEHSRQIGTTGVVVDPQLYLAFGISGAVQHTAGLGDPSHIISVNTDRYCPMMELADLAVVADANETLDALAELLDRHAERSALAGVTTDHGWVPGAAPDHGVTADA